MSINVKAILGDRSQLAANKALPRICRRGLERSGSGWRRRLAVSPRQEKAGSKGPLEVCLGYPSSILAWRIPWTEEPGRVRSQRVRHD